MIRVCLVEDQTIVRQGLRTLLDLVDDIEVVAEAVDGEDAVRRIPDATRTWCSWICGCPGSTGWAS